MMGPVKDRPTQLSALPPTGLLLRTKPSQQTGNRPHVLTYYYVFKIAVRGCEKRICAYSHWSGFTSAIYTFG